MKHYNYTIRELYSIEHDDLWFESVQTVRKKVKAAYGCDIFKQRLKEFSRDADLCLNGKSAGTPLRGRELQKFYKDCWNSDLVRHVNVRYNAGGYITLRLLLGHEPSEDEKAELEEGIEGQFTDGYWECPERLFEIDGTEYYLEA